MDCGIYSASWDIPVTIVSPSPFFTGRGEGQGRSPLPEAISVICPFEEPRRRPLPVKNGEGEPFISRIAEAAPKR